jgi:hypothetical protein
MFLREDANRQRRSTSNFRSISMFKQKGKENMSQTIGRFGGSRSQAAAALMATAALAITSGCGALSEPELGGEELPSNASDILATAEQAAGQLVQEAGATGAVQCVFIEDKVGYRGASVLCGPHNFPGQGLTFLQADIALPSFPDGGDEAGIGAAAVG